MNLVFFVIQMYLNTFTHVSYLLRQSKYFMYEIEQRLNHYDG